MNVCYTVLPEWNIGIERVRFCNIIRHEPSKGLQRTNQYSCTPHPWCTKPEAPWQCGDSARSAQIKAKREYQPVIWWFKAVVWNICGQSSYRRVSVALLHLTYQKTLKLLQKNLFFGVTAAASCCFWRLQGSNTWHRPHGKLAGHKGWRQSEHLNKCVIPLRRVTFIICSSPLFSTASPLFSSSAIFALEHGAAAKSDSELEQNAPSYLITIRY